MEPALGSSCGNFHIVFVASSLVISYDHRRSITNPAHRNCGQRKAPRVVVVGGAGHMSLIPWHTLGGPHSIAPDIGRLHLAQWSIVLQICKGASSLPKLMK